jgi:poly-gamma-glutamate synthesis protein (capsule biosynthesis protein)
MACPDGGHRLRRLLAGVAVGAAVTASLASASAALADAPTGGHTALPTAPLGDSTHPSFAGSWSTGTREPTPAGDEDGSVRLMVMGDVMLARSVATAINQRGPGIVFRGVNDELTSADLTVVNLECVIGTTGTPAHKHFTFQAPPISANELALAGVDVAGQANNHALDFGPQALAETRSILAGQGIAVAGAGPDRDSAHAPVIMLRSGLRIAFLAYVAAFPERSGLSTASWVAGDHTPGVAIARPSVIRANVRAALQQADLVVVLLHAGIEGSGTPTSVQRRLARAAIGAGATLVVGAHPHMLQGYALKDGHLIAYGLGNFVFDKTGGNGADSAILDVTLTSAGVSQLHWIPVVIRAGLPTLADGADARRIRRVLRPI